MPVTFYAWCCPAYTTGSPVDHTWVTTYDNRVTCHPDIKSVVQAGQDFWFSWGVFHDKGGTPKNATGFLCSPAGNLGLARCLVKPNVDCHSDQQAKGTIFQYGVDGVCHQLSNQILFATGGQPSTVSGVRGYMASTFLYGTYGRRQSAAWAAKIAACTGPVPMASGAGSGGGSVNQQDEFEAQARAVLGRDEPVLFDRLMALRREVEVMTSRPLAGEPDAETLNRRNQLMLDEAAKILGPKKFEEVFGFSPDERINLVVPEIADRLQSR